LSSAAWWVCSRGASQEVAECAPAIVNSRITQASVAGPVLSFAHCSQVNELLNDEGNDSITALLRELGVK
jgi:hypothetical protein